MHPDKAVQFGDDAKDAATAAFKAISAAYQVLANTTTRRDYDEQLRSTTNFFASETVDIAGILGGPDALSVAFRRMLRGYQDAFSSGRTKWQTRDAFEATLSAAMRSLIDKAVASLKVPSFSST